MFSTIEKPILIAGPCSAESEEQLDCITKELATTRQVDLLRAGIWKPRTRPGSFEGVGEIGLNWLAKVGKKYGIPTTTEVANIKHVEQALKAGIDVLWIGARTTVNPFSVQEIADALQGVKVPVMIKNPINPDLNLWVGAIERIRNAGITEIAAIHRGFSSYEKTKFRNIPKWGIPVELMQLFPEIPIICDPSHIGGARDLISSVSQKALDMNMSGLMIETHHKPDQALSDAKQQITPARLTDILNELVIRNPNPAKGTDYILDDLRSKIDEIDEDLINNLARRFEVIDKIGAYKKDNNMTILQIERWFEILSSRKKSGSSKGLRDEFIDEVLKSIHKESVYQQTNILNRD